MDNIKNINDPSIQNEIEKFRMIEEIEKKEKYFTYPCIPYEIKYNDRDIVLLPKDCEYEYVLIWLHGFGSSPKEYLDDFYGAGNIDKVPDKTKIILPCAPNISIERLNNEKHNSWYGYPKEGGHNMDDVSKNGKSIIKIINEEANKLKGRYNRIIVGGFSQGASMAFYIGLTYMNLIGGIVVCSGKLFSGIKIRKENEKLKIFIGHGEKDRRIPINKLKYSIQKIANYPNLEKHFYPENAHQISYEEFCDVGRFIKKIFTTKKEKDK